MRGITITACPFHNDRMRDYLSIRAARRRDRVWVVALLVALAGCRSDSLSQDRGTGDGTAVPSPTCGDKTIMSRLATCRAATEESTCKNAGGDWRQFGHTRVPHYLCVCPTGQEGCACNSAADCVESRACQAEPVNGFIGLTCDGVVDYKCARTTPWIGCMCTIDNGIQIWCRD
jgi:hypothetical protein